MFRNCFKFLERGCMVYLITWVTFFIRTNSVWILNSQLRFCETILLRRQLFHVTSCTQTKRELVAKTIIQKLVTLLRRIAGRVATTWRQVSCNVYWLLRLKLTLQFGSQLVMVAFSLRIHFSLESYACKGVSAVKHGKNMVRW